MTKPSRGRSPANENAARLDAFYSYLAANKLDGALLDRRDDIFYLSGFTGSDSVALLDAKKRRGWLVTDSRYTEEGEATAVGLRTELWKEGFAAFVGKRMKNLGFRRIGHTPATLTVSFYNAMRAETGGAASWRDVGDGLAQLRAVKSPGEIKAIQKALACAEDAFNAARQRWRIGMTELEVKNDLEWEMRRRGADDAAFETIVAAGANASLPHAHAGNGKIRPGKMLLIDFGARVGRYNSDLTRTLWAERVPAVWLKRYRTVLAAQQAGIAAIRAGAGRAEPDLKAREIFSRSGLNERFTHSLGHGVGLAVHESPSMGRRAAGELAAGNIVTVEPGVYFPGSGGIRVEDMALVTEDGCRILSSLPKDVGSLVL